MLLSPERYDAATGQAREGLDPNEWFPVPGMSGGFSFSFQKAGASGIMCSKSSQMNEAHVGMHVLPCLLHNGFLYNRTMLYGTWTTEPHFLFAAWAGARADGGKLVQSCWWIRSAAQAVIARRV